MQLGHIALSVSKLDKSIAFYRKHFGLKCAEKYLHKETGLTIAVLKKGDVGLELFEFKKYKPLPEYRKDLDTDLRTIGVKHFSLEIGNIARLYKKLKRAKVSFATDMRVFDNGRRYFFIKDPDGNLVEMMER
jgi:catechol 2,3-dioxygenase-like lactoylglutathione lyase family enzyme